MLLLNLGSRLTIDLLIADIFKRRQLIVYFFLFLAQLSIVCFVSKKDLKYFINYNLYSLVKKAGKNIYIYIFVVFNQVQVE